MSSTTMFTASRSAQLFERASRVMPGGVSSPVRAFGGVGGTPLFLARGQGSRVWDEDGQEYLDFMSSWGPLILGHAHPRVTAAVTEAMTQGTSFGTPCTAELELAEKVVDLSPVAEQVRFVSSGTEATMSALRLARAATGRDGVVKFEGCYHGHGDAFLVKAGSGLATFGESSSAGVPEAWSQLTGVLPLDDEGALREWFQRHGGQTAAVFVEGIPANCGLLRQRPEWMRLLRELTRAHQALLVVDEVITGFRLAPGGYCGREHYDADLVTYGKVIGGGLPVGAYAGPERLMQQVAPQGGAYQAGTLSGNPVAMTAGLATLSVLEEEHGWERLEKLGAAWEDRLAPLLARESEAGYPVGFVREGSIFWLCFGCEEAPRRYDRIPAEGAARYGRLFHALLDRGVMVAPSAYEVGFLSLAMTEQDLDFAAEQFAAALELAR